MATTTTGDRAVHELCRSLREAILGAPRGELPAFIGELEVIRAEAWLRLAEPEPPKSENILINAADMARRCGITEYDVLDRARRGKIPAVRVGRLMRFDPDEVLAALRMNGGTAK